MAQAGNEKYVTCVICVMWFGRGVRPLSFSHFGLEETCGECLHLDRRDKRMHIQNLLSALSRENTHGLGFHVLSLQHKH